MTRVAVFGGSFNPPHVSHVLAITYVLATAPIDEVVVIPAFDHPLGKSLAPFDHRLEMCRLAFEDTRRVSISTVEREMGGESRTLYTLQELVRRNPDWQMRLVIGSDILFEKHKWFAWDQVVALAPPIVLGRAGYDSPDAPVAVIPEVASRDVRAEIARGSDVSGLVPRRVISYVREHGLYREAK